MAGSGIFISYRRDDTSGYVGRLADDLGARFGPERVFVDYQDVAVAAPFPTWITDSVRTSAAVVAVIGPRWNERLPDGSRRLDDRANWVRVELTYALSNHVPIVPVLVGNEPPPESGSLPPELEPLASQNMLVLHDWDWAADVQRLVMTLANIGSTPNRELSPERPAPVPGGPGPAPAGEDSLPSFPGLGPQGQIDVRGGWVAAGDVDSLERAAASALARHGLRAAGRRDRVLMFEGGSAWRTRIKGFPLTPDDGLPKAARVLISGRGLRSAVEVLLYETFGAGARRERYERVFESIIEDVRTATRNPP